MGINRYQRTLAAVRPRLLAEFSNARPGEGATDDVSHTLWMIEQISRMTDQGRIDRRAGCICAKAHSLGVSGYSINTNP